MNPRATAILCVHLVCRRLMLSDTLHATKPFLLKLRLQTGIVVTDPVHLRHVMDKNQKNYPKDVELAYKPFLVSFSHFLSPA